MKDGYQLLFNNLGKLYTVENIRSDPNEFFKHMSAGNMIPAGVWQK